MNEENIECEHCGESMENLGNVQRRVMMSRPPQWIGTYVCHSCKTTREVHKKGTLPSDNRNPRDSQPD